MQLFCCHCNVTKAIIAKIWAAEKVAHALLTIPCTFFELNSGKSMSGKLLNCSSCLGQISTMPIPKTLTPLLMQVFRVALTRAVLSAWLFNLAADLTSQHSLQSMWLVLLA